MSTEQENLESAPTLVDPELESTDVEEMEGEPFDYRTLETTDEHGTEWVEVEYTYECPTSNYCDGEETETIDMIYKGPKELFLWVWKNTGEIHTVHRRWEAEMETNNFTDDLDEEEEALILLDATEFPLEAEVLSDYHDNYKDWEDYEETPPLRTLNLPEGYHGFSYPYPIHPDELYDDKKSVYNFETGQIELHKNSNEDIIGEAPTWEQLREDRDQRLEGTDTLWLILKDIDPERWAKIDKYRQLLRDFPAMIEENNIPLIFADSCFPPHPDITTPEDEGRV